MFQGGIKIRIFTQCHFNNEVEKQVQKIVSQRYIFRINTDINSDIFPSQLTEIEIITISTFTNGWEINQAHFLTERTINA
ncbi:hypothetical protein NGUA18_04909 [Salmonella enterica]|nr:hypothetical protein NGUA18_04909 [Salmonella enterica]